MIHRTVRSTVFITWFSAVALFAQSPLSRISELVTEFNTTLEELAKSTVLQSHDSYFVNDLFLSIIRQNQAIEAVAKIDTQGVVVNHVTLPGASGISKNVAAERWFRTAADTRQPCNEILSEPAGRIVLYRAWPLTDGTPSPSGFVGVFSVRINVKKLFESLAANESSPLQVIYKGESIASNNWKENERYDQESITLPGGTQFTLRTQNLPDSALELTHRAAPSLPDESEADSFTIPPAREEAATAPSVPQKKDSASPKHSVTKTIPSHSLQSAVLSDSFLFATTLSTINGYRIIMLIAISVLLLIAIAVALVIAIRKMIRKNDATAAARDVSSGPIEAIMIPEQGNGAPTLDMNEVPLTEDLDLTLDIASAERETKELPALRELIAESSHTLKTLDHTADAALRSKVLKQIHEDLSVWVSGELRRLNNQLSSLSQSIRECENTDGHSAELQVLRYEIERIIGEIQAVDQKIPNEIFS
jgi:hypothetical protein